MSASTPGAAQWILDRAKSEQEHRHWIERKNSLSNNYARIAGLTFAGFLALVSIGGAIWLVSLGRDLAGFAAFFTALATLIGLFVYRERNLRRDPVSEGKVE